MNTAKFVKEVTIVDPDNMNEVEVSIFKHQNGGMFGLDASFIDQELEEGFEIAIDPFDTNSNVRLIWE